MILYNDLLTCFFRGLAPAAQSAIKGWLGRGARRCLDNWECENAWRSTRWMLGMYSGNCVGQSLPADKRESSPAAKLKLVSGPAPCKKAASALAFSHISLSPALLSRQPACSRAPRCTSAGLGSQSLGWARLCQLYSLWEMRLLNNYTPAATCLTCKHTATSAELCASEIARGGVYFNAFTSCAGWYG